jgi:hypothetical protein
MEISAQQVKSELKGAELLTGKQRAFAEFYVTNYPDCTKQEAARHAGYAETTTGKWGSLLTNPDKFPHVVAYIEKLRDLKTNTYKDYLRHLKRLDSLSKKAEDKNQLAAAINAEFRLGQAAGFYIDRKEIKVQDLSAMTKDELIKTINELKDEIPFEKVIEIEAEEKAKLS